MATTHLDYANLFAKSAPEGSAPWGGFPTYNFVGGHNNPETMPIEDFVESSARVLRQEGQNLATYNMESGHRATPGCGDFSSRNWPTIAACERPVKTS